MTRRDFLWSVLGGVVIAVILGAFAIPAYNARSDQRLKTLEENYEEAKERLTDIDVKLNDNIIEVKDRVYALEKVLEAIKSIDPITIECAEIMKDIRQPKGMGVFSLDKETGKSVNLVASELMERFEKLGCSQRVQ